MSVTVNLYNNFLSLLTSCVCPLHPPPYILFLTIFVVSSWGRWKDILSHARCKRRLSERDVETICRVILVFCLLHYRGDENIKSFIWELITPPENGREPQTLLNHSGRESHTHIV